MKRTDNTYLAFDIGASSGPAVMAGLPLPEAAKKTENKALRGALEKWGYMQRPKAPWVRLAPEYQPKPMKFDD